MLTQTDLNEKRKDKYTLSILRVVKILVPIDRTLLIIRAALGTILMFIVLMAHEFAGVGGNQSSASTVFIDVPSLL